MAKKKSELESASMVELIAYRDEISRRMDDNRAMLKAEDSAAANRELIKARTKVNERILEKINEICGEG